MRHAPKTRASLILRLKNREDLDAWQQFAEIYQPLVFRLARRKGFQDSDAADVAQEVLLRVANAVERWDPDGHGSFRGWLYRIARNFMINFLQSHQRRPIAGGSDAVLELLDNHPDPNSLESKAFDEELEQQVFAWASERIRPSFKTNTWDAFWATAVEGRPADAVAIELGISVGAVYIARSRVIQKLKEEVKRVLSEKQLEDA